MKLKHLYLYIALIFPHISYCIHVWVLHHLFRFIDFMFFRKKYILYNLFAPRTHTEPLCKALHILNVNPVRDYSLALFMYKLMNHMLPSMFENIFIKTSDVHNYSTRQADTLYVQYASAKKNAAHDDVIKWKHFPRYWPFYAGNSPVHGEFPTQRPVTRSFDVFFDLRLNKRLSKQSWGWWSEKPSSSLWRHRNGTIKRREYRSSVLLVLCAVTDGFLTGAVSSKRVSKVEGISIFIT